MRTSSVEEIMNCLEQGAHALVGVRQVCIPSPLRFFVQVRFST